MVRLLTSKKAVILAIALLGATVVGLGVSLAASTVLRDTNDVRLRVIASEFADGFESTWHVHPGPVIVQVQEGAFKIYQGSCQPTVVQAGETYIEIPFVPIKAVAKGPIKWTTTQIVPQADAPATDVSSPCG
jgi:quercetin dioxygenase-like cupin family protein